MNCDSLPTIALGFDASTLLGELFHC